MTYNTDDYEKADSLFRQRQRACEFLEHVGHMNKPFVAFRFGVVHHGVGAACRQCLEGELIAVERCASQGEEYGAFWAIARVGSHRGVREVEVVKFVEGHIGIIYYTCWLNRSYASIILL